MENINISSFKPLIQPILLKKLYPITSEIQNLVNMTRNEISNIISGKSDKKLFIVGPCSIHDTKEAFEYAKELKKIYPNASITYITSHRALTETNPYIDFSYERKFPKCLIQLQ